MSQRNRYQQRELAGGVSIVPISTLIAKAIFVKCVVKLLTVCRNETKNMNPNDIKECYHWNKKYSLMIQKQALTEVLNFWKF